MAELDNIAFARWQMGLSLGFHIVFAAVGVTMPLLMVLAEWLAIRRKDPEYLRLAKIWAKGTAVFFAVGAVSGTVLSFELGLLFPTFMERAGAVIGLPFALEGFAFFTEAIFLGIYLYGWERVSPRAHLLAGMIVAASGALSAVFVTMANSWMNHPTGCQLVGDQFTDIDPLRAMTGPFIWHEVPHTLLAAYVACGMAVAGIHARALLVGSSTSLNAKALRIALAVALPVSIVQPAVGHFAGHEVAHYQPLKLAAMEWLEETTTGAPLVIGPVKIPGALSWLATGDPQATVQGLDAFSPHDWPSRTVHYAFQIMVLAGTLLALLAVVGLVRWRRVATSRRLLWSVLLASPLGIVAMETGWLVTELGRQPWVIYGILRTKQAVTPMPGLIVPLTVFTLVYLALLVIVLAIMRRHVANVSRSGA